MELEVSQVKDQALVELKRLQMRDYKHLDKQMDMAKDEIITDLSFGRLALTIPDDHYEVLTIAFPMLQNRDAQAKTLAWKEFMNSDLSLPYKPNASMRAM